MESRRGSSSHIRIQSCMYSVGRYSLCGVMNIGSIALSRGDPPVPTKPTITPLSASKRAADSVIDVPIPNNKKAVFL